VTDYDRQRHQQQLLRAIVSKIASPDTFTNLATVKNLQESAGDLLTLDLGASAIEDWVLTLSSLRPSDMIMIQTYGGQLHGIQIEGISYEVLDEDLIELLESVQTDTVFDFLARHPDWVAPAS
jgi:anionic cell wall polymer biosynthesis LytR-Cps2A-Psr (LCP) family protein